MQKAPIPQNEVTRLNALLEFNVLDTPPELAYDDITRIASAICKTPIALVSLIDADRQWFKSRVGLDATETPRDVSFCGHAIASQELFEIEDSLLDPRFSDNPLAVGAPHVRFYAGAPLMTRSNEAIGTLCVIDHQPGKLSPGQRAALEALARQVVHLLELRKSSEQNLKNLQEIVRSTQVILKQQEQLVESAKMVSLGSVASGVAHEINNPLGIIILKTEQLLKSQKNSSISEENLQENLNKILEASWRMQKIVRGLKTFSRDAKSDPVERISIQTMLEDSTSFCLEKIRSRKIDFRIQTNQNESILCRPSEVCQAMVNILENAIYAVQKLESKWISITTLVNGDFLKIMISDSGPGIEPSVAKRMMEPFFTTKPVGEGTGLGLSISLGLIESQGGRLYYDPDSAHTRFVIELPLAETDD